MTDSESFWEELKEAELHNDDYWQTLAAELTAVEGSRMFLLELENKVIGFVYGIKKDTQGCRIGGLWVAPEYRKKGYGNLLIQQVISWAQNNFKDVAIKLWSPAGSMIAFYEKNNFKKSPNVKTHPNDGREVVEMEFMGYAVCDASKILIRPYGPGDMPGVRHLILPIQQEEFGVPITWEDQPDLHDIPAFYRRGGGEFWVAEAVGKIVGSIALIDIGGAMAVIRKMFVEAEWRGKVYGIAQKLLDGLIMHARSHGIKHIFLGTTEKYLAAHRFYERNQFSHIQATDLPPAFPRIAVDTRFYHLPL